MSFTFFWWQAVPTCLSKVCRARICGACPGPGKGALFSNWRESGKRKLFSGSFIGLVPSPDAEHVVAVSGEGVESFAIADGKHEIIAKPQYPWSAEYSGSGKFLGILGNTSIAEQSAPPPGTQVTADDDDGPDCTGGSSA